MASLEIETLRPLQTPPKLYGRYIDDIILVVDNEDQIQTIKEKFIENSVLNFTSEIGNKKLAFLDVLLEIDDNDDIHTSVYTKSTNMGELLNYHSECPER